MAKSTRVSRAAVKEFLARPLEDHYWIKKLSLRELLKDMAEECPGFTWKHQNTPGKRPFKHQVACFLLGTAFPGFLFFVAQGGGKSRVALALQEFWMSKDKVRNSLILVPKNTNVENWRDQVEDWSDCTFIPLCHGKAKNWKELEKYGKDPKGGHVFVISYPSFSALLSELRAVGKSKKKKRAINMDSVDKLSELVQMLVPDESQKIKNPEALVSQCVAEVSYSVPYRYPMTGTPMKEPIDLWSQFYIADQGETFGDNPYIFYYSFYREYSSYFGAEWRFDNTKTRKLQGMMRNRSIRYAEKEFADLPPLTLITKKGVMSDDQIDMYKEIQKKALEAKKLELEEVTNTWIKFRQISAGFVLVKHDGLSVPVDFKENPRMDLMEEVVEGLVDTDKIFIFYDFVHSGELLVKRMRELQLPFAWVSPTNKKLYDPAEELRKFKTDPAITVGLCNWRQGSEGLNLQIANYLAFYETPVSPIDRSQAIKRNHRTGQTRHCFAFDFHMRGTTDGQILQNLHEGLDLSATLLGDKSEDHAGWRKLLTSTESFKPGGK